MSTFSFITRDFLGAPKAFYFVDELTPPQPKPTKSVAHHIYIVDVSGSMYGVIADTKAMLEKVMTVEEFNDEGQFVSLLTYSSKGDVSLLIDRVSVKELLKPGSVYVEKIRGLQAKALTCASQAFEMALSLVKEETTAISLHTDGFFNDPSYVAEMKAFLRLIERAKPMTGLFVNTVAYGYADYVTLSKISDALSGKCVQATTVKDVYNALHDTQALLAGRMVPAIQVNKEDYDFLVASNMSQSKVNGSTTDLSLRGVRPEDKLKIYRFRKLSEQTFLRYVKEGKASAPLPNEAIYAFARSKLAKGKINEAKFALCATKNQTLLARHSKALTPDQLVPFAKDLEDVLFNGADKAHEFATETFGLPNANRPSLVALFSLLSANKDKFTVDLDRMMKLSYPRRGLKSLAGTWSHEAIEKPTPEQIAAGTFIPCAYDTEPIDESTMVECNGFEFNNDAATINMLLARPCKLMHKPDPKKPESKVEIKSVAGIKMLGTLFSYRNYTLVANGDLNVGTLPLRISDKRLFEELKAAGAVRDEALNATKIYEIDLTYYPLVSYDAPKLEVPADLTQRLALRRALLSLFSAIKKAKSTMATGTERFTGEQVMELSKYYLSEKLYFQPPMRVPYKDKKEAVNKGLVDHRPKITVSMGSPLLPDVTDLQSANKFFERRFVVTDREGKKQDVNLEAVWKGWNEYSVAEKEVSSRMKITPQDDLLFPIYVDLLKTKSQKEHQGAFTAAVQMCTGKPFSGTLFGSKHEQSLATIETLEKDIASAQEKDYEKYIRPFVFYTGSSGLLPDGWDDVEALDQDEMKKRFPKTGKLSKDALYYVNGETVIVVSLEDQAFSTPLGVAVAQALQKGA